MSWRVRFEGSDTVVPVPTPAKVLEGLKEGEWDSTDLVRGPADAGWTPIADHPQFAEPVAELEAPEPKHDEETHLDMNPLIDVALVLLVFFILTTTYASLRRTIDVPAEPENKGPSQPRPTDEELDQKTFHLVCWLEDGKPTIKIEEKVIELKELEKEVKAFVKSTGRTEMLLEVDGRVPWGVEAQIHDAAKAADIVQIYRKPKKKELAKPK